LVDTERKRYTVFAMEQESKKLKRKRRAFPPEFKAEVVRLVLDEGKSVAGVSKELDLTASAVSQWVERARADRGKSKRGTLTTEEREELARLRKENRELKMQREILKKAAAFFAKENA
jgi:transposase